MPKSGNAETPRLKRKAKKRIENFPGLVQDASPTSSTALLAPGDARVERALARWKITKKTWEASPEITPIIWRTMGNQKNAVLMLRFSDDPECRKFLEFYWEMTKDDQERLPLEIACLACGVSPQHILGQIILSARDASRAESALVAITQNPAVLKATADFGVQYPDNVKDREMMLKITKTLPTPQGGGINIFVGDKQDDEDEVDPSESNLESDVFDYDTKTIEGWGDQRRQLMDKRK